MKRSDFVALTLAFTLTAGLALPSALAQNVMFGRPGAKPQPARSMRLAQASPSRSVVSPNQPEMLPSPPGAPDPFQDDGYYASDRGGPMVYGEDFGGYADFGPGYGCPCDGYPCDAGCCGPPQPSWWDCFDVCGLCGTSTNAPRWYFLAEYLYARASFSEAVAYLIHDDSGTPTEFHDTFVDLDFQHQSSYRFGGGYLLGCCDEQLRFVYTRLQSEASAFTTNPLAVGPFETSPGPEGFLDVHADVDSHSFDLEYAKTIPLGGDCCGCGDACCDPCGCGDACCPPPCPAWDITWSGGLRFADVSWTRTYDSFNFETETGRDAISTMDFEGGGPKFGLEGRRYFGQSNWCSVYLKGDISLLLGHADFFEGRVNFDEETVTPDVVFTQRARNRNIIPVTEIEAGLTAQLTKCSRFSTGYFFGAWHDLGFRDQFDFATFLETGYDDANILGWDGYFARFEFVY